MSVLSYFDHNEFPLAYLRSLQNFYSVLVMKSMQKGNIFMILLENKYFDSHKIKDFTGETIMSIQLIH